MTALLEVAGLTVRTRAGAAILRGVDLSLAEGAVLGVVGESGSGKSTLGAAVMGMLPASLRAEGRVELAGQDLLRLSPRAGRALRGTALAAVGQDPMTALNPLFTVATHLVDVARRRHPGLSRAQARARAEAVLARTGIADPAARMRAYPHQLSGGMRQRVAIGMALLAEPRLLVADEPTTALDATVEAQVAALFAGLRDERSASVVFISHHLALVAGLADRICVLYAGTAVETGPAQAVIRTPRHPYTRALLACEIEPEGTGPLRFIAGDVPDPAAPPPGCVFAPRCALAIPACLTAQPPLLDAGPDHRAACIRLHDGV